MVLFNAMGTALVRQMARDGDGEAQFSLGCRQGLTLLHFSAHPEPFSTPKLSNVDECTSQKLLTSSRKVE